MRRNKDEILGLATELLGTLVYAVLILILTVVIVR